MSGIAPPTPRHKHRSTPNTSHQTPIRLHSKPRRLSLKNLLITSIFLGVFSFVWAGLESIKSRWYIFDPPVLHSLVKEAISLHGNDTVSVLSHLVTSLQQTHPSFSINSHFSSTPLLSDPTTQAIIPESYTANEREWVWNNAGGAMGHMFVIHASITEYLILFGTPLGTEGHSGRHTADDYFHILQGEQWAAKAGAFEMERYVAGDVHHLVRGEVKQYKFHEGGFALELAQGWIPLMLPFGFADTFFSTLDIPTLYHTVRITGREMIKNLLHGKI
ncbi:hypothetical protein JCM16303_006023 [Sporobolomyces ruberrimus]